MTRRLAPHYLERDASPPSGPRESRPIRSPASLVLFALLVATSAHGAEEPGPLSGESLPERFAAPGEPGFVSDLHMGTGLPLAYLGLIAGGVSLRDALLPVTRPWPGIQEIAAPLAWYDSTTTLVGEDGGWLGFSASLVELRGIAPPPIEKKPRAAFTLMSGTSAVDRTGLLLSRGGDAGWARGGALAEERSGAGILSRHGQHVWFAEVGRKLGAHTFSGTFSERGVAGGTRLVELPSGIVPPPYAGFDETARGESGGLSWHWQGAGRSLRVDWSRSHDHRESAELPVFDEALGVVAAHFFAEREAQENGVVVEASAGSEGRSHGLRLELRQAEVRRSVDFLGQVPANERTEQSAWLAARAERPLAGGSLQVQVGGGHARSPDLAAERWQAAPSVAWSAGSDARQLRLHAERLVTPVWSDLAPGVQPFVQDVWLAGVEASLGDGRRQWLRLGALGADIGNRASLVRFPIRDVSLRLGWRREGVRVRDGMVTAAAGVRRSAWALEASGFSRVRPIGTQPANVDPALGARAAAETGFHAFAGDLGVTLRIESAWVGAREHESFPGYFSPPRPLAGYATYGASAAFTLGDARIVVRAANLEDEPHPQIWTDPSSPFPGEPAAGTGRQLRVELVWPLFN